MSKKRAKKKKKTARKDRKKKRLTAKTADRHELYEKSVQCPEADCDFIDRVFKKRYGRKPELLREDFCGTAFLCRTWADRRRKNRSIGVDMHESTLAWARERVEALGSETAERVTLLCDDVRNVNTPKVDVVVAMNFSYLVFRTREELRGYFAGVRESLRKEGMFLLDLYGGPESMSIEEEATDHDGFTYVWDQHAFNPITHETVCHIHFEFPRGGGRMRRAFSYEWRLWTIPEVREVLEEAGFHDVVVYWEGTAKDGTGNGVFRPSTKGDDSASFVVYIGALP